MSGCFLRRINHRRRGEKTAAQSFGYTCMNAKRENIHSKERLFKAHDKVQWNSSCLRLHTRIFGCYLVFFFIKKIGQCCTRRRFSLPSIARRARRKALSLPPLDPSSHSNHAGVKNLMNASRKRGKRGREEEGSTVMKRLSLHQGRGGGSRKHTLGGCTSSIFQTHVGVGSRERFF